MINHQKELRLLIDLDAEKGVEPRPGRSNTVRVKVTQATKINLEVLHKYLQGEYKFDSDVLQCISMCRITINICIR